MTEQATQFEFEKALHELNELVSQMERGDISLEDALSHFEKGITLTRKCQTALQDAEQKVKILLAKSGKDSLEPFANNED